MTYISLFFLLCKVLIDSTGYEVKLEKTPERIVSLAPCITEELYLLGVDEKIVGVTLYCTEPEQAREKEKVGTYIAPNIEKIISLNPDIIFATKEGHRKELIDKLRSLNLNVFVFPARKSFSDICNELLMLGNITNREEIAERIVKDAKVKVDSITKNISRNVPTLIPKVFWEIGVKPLVTAGENTFIDEMTILAGGVNIAHSYGNGYFRYSREQVIRQNPDVIILITMGDVTKDEIREWQKYEEVKAVKENKIYVFDAHKFCSPTPVTFAEGLKEISSLFHPEIFK